MKQKRKETALLSGKVGLKGGLIITLLSVLGGAIGLALLGLQTKSVSAEPNPGTMGINYQGVNDQTEVLGGLYFIDKDAQSEDLYKVYETPDSLYVTSNNVVVNQFVQGLEKINHGDGSNKVAEGVYGHILGGDDINLSSENVTIIGGSSNKVNASNSNAVVLGGNGNGMLAGNGVTSLLGLALIGGKGNLMDSPVGLAGIIGGISNTIKGLAKDAIILGGNNNNVYGENVILAGGKKVRVGDEESSANVANVFVFSDDRIYDSDDDLLRIYNTLPDESSNAFYLNVENGLGINKNSNNEGGVEVEGAVEFGDIQIGAPTDQDPKKRCDENNYGVQGVWNAGGIACLVGCTEKGWELMDSSDECKEKCESDSNCMSEDIKNNNTGDGKCEGALEVKDGRMNRCTDVNGNPLDETKFKDIVFERVLIDSDALCPSVVGGPLANNQCVYKCAPGYHLRTNYINMPSKGLKNGETGCYQSCNLDGKIIHHGDTDIWYSEEEVDCAYDEEDTKHDKKSVWTCNNYKVRLICADGTLYRAKTQSGKYAPGTIVTDGDHLHSTCRLNGYACNNTKYLLSKSDITGRDFPEVNISISDVDRSVSVGERGEYALCINYQAKSNDICEPYEPKYEVKCNNKTSLVDVGDGKFQCAYKCTDAAGVPQKHGSKTLAFKSDSVYCDDPNSKCERVEVQCYDGQWYEVGTWTENHNRTCETVSANACDLNDYDIPDSVYNTFVNLSKYSNQSEFYKSCGSIQRNENTDPESCIGEANHKFNGCGDGYNELETTLATLGHPVMKICEKKPTCGAYTPSKDILCNDSILVDNYVSSTTDENGDVGHSWKCEGEFGTKIECNESHKCTGNRPEGDGVLKSLKYPTVSTDEKDWTPMPEKSQSELAPCEYTCEKGYHVDGSGCTPNECKGHLDENYEFISVKLPENTETQYVCDATSTDACAYRCKEDWVCKNDGSACEPYCKQGVVVTYYAEGETFTRTVSYKGNVDLTLRPTNDERFNGWSKTETSQERLDKLVVSECSDIYLYAMYSARVDAHCEDTHFGCSIGSHHVNPMGSATTAKYTWQCISDTGGNPDSCEEKNNIDGICGKTEPWTCGNPTTIIESSKDQTDTQWLWSCKGINDGKTVSCTMGKDIDGKCGKEKEYTCITPTTLIESSKDQNDLQFLWTCKGVNNGDNTNCSMTIPCTENCGPIDGKCGSKPYQCEGLDATNTNEESDKWTWICPGENNGANAPCEMEKETLVSEDGECLINGERNQCKSSLPATDSTEYSDKYTWICPGNNGGENSPTCVLPRKVDGRCSSTVGKCEKGTNPKGDGEVDDLGTQWGWDCEGINEGKDATCSKDKDEQEADCTGNPDNSYWVKGKFGQTKQGDSWIPANISPTHTDDSSVECSFQCNKNYKYEDNNCKPEGHIESCDDSKLPPRTKWVNGSFSQTWNNASNAYKPTKQEKSAQYSTDGSVECSYKCEDEEHYEWNGSACVGKSQSANCGGKLPDNSKKKSGHGQYTQTWINGAWTPTTKWQHDASECGFLCIDEGEHYVWDGNNCNPKTQPASCGELPENAEATTEDGYTQKWNGTIFAPIKSWTYGQQEICGFKCIDDGVHYVWDGNNCNPKTNTSNCSGEIPQCAHAKTGHSTFVQTWNKIENKFTPVTLSWKYNEPECGYVCDANTTSDGHGNCNPNTQQVNCGGSVPANAVAMTSSGYTQTWDCTSKAWTPTGKQWKHGESVCGFTCIDEGVHYEWKNGACVAKTQEADCDNSKKPNNSYWVNGKFKQTWNGSKWNPTSVTPTYSNDRSVECSYQCNKNYKYEDNDCKPEGHIESCDDSKLPPRTKWVNGSFSQTWNNASNAYKPTKQEKSAQYSTDGSVECSYKCEDEEHYEWNGSACVEKTQPASCGELPENAVATTATEYTQTWNGTVYAPNKSWTYGEQEICGYKCIDENVHFVWNGSACVEKTSEVSCGELPENAVATTATKYTQKWNKTAKAWDPVKQWTYGASICGYKCVDEDVHFVWNGNDCVEKEQTVSCGVLPTNAVATTSTTYTQKWNKTAKAWDPVKQWTYGASICGYKCDEHYVYDVQAGCKLETNEASCGELPENAVAITATKYIQTWNKGANTFKPVRTWKYGETTGCGFECVDDGVHFVWNGSACVAKTQPASCSGGIPQCAHAKTGHSTFVQTWNKTENKFTPSTRSWGYDKSECGYLCDTNATWNGYGSCNPNTRTQECGGSIPANAVATTSSGYAQTWDCTSNAWTPTGIQWKHGESVCGFKCIDEGEHFEWKNGACVAKTREATCESESNIPKCAVKKSGHGKYIQTWNRTANAWTPKKSWSYEQSECGFECVKNASWNGYGKCNPNTNNPKCGGSIPANAVATTSDTYTKTFDCDSNTWTPTDLKWKHDASECGFKCIDEGVHYVWSGGSCQPMSRTGNCVGDLPANTVKKSGHGEYTQTWDGTKWSPTTEWKYDASECGYVCALNYYRKNNQCLLMSYSCGKTLSNKNTCIGADGSVISGSNLTHIDNEYGRKCSGGIDCALCDEASPLKGQEPTNHGSGDCKKLCNNCAKNGFPYCFPIDFSSTCVESDYPSS